MLLICIYLHTSFIMLYHQFSSESKAWGLKLVDPQIQTRYATCCGWLQISAFNCMIKSMKEKMMDRFGHWWWLLKDLGEILCRGFKVGCMAGWNGIGGIDFSSSQFSLEQSQLTTKKSALGCYKLSVLRAGSRIIPRRKDNRSTIGQKSEQGKSGDGGMQDKPEN